MKLNNILFSLAIGLFAGFLFLVLMAQFNYTNAVNAAKNSEGSDLAITTTMQSYGFSQDVFEPVTMKDKVIALFHSNHN